MENKNYVKTNLLPHSKAKVDFYEKYLARYLRILARAPFIQEINVWDVFCGRGFFDNHGEGSPVRAIKVLKNLEQELLSHKKQVTLYLNDKDANNIQNFKDYAIINFPKSFFLKFLCQDAQALMDTMQNKQSFHKPSVSNLFFIDPYGYSHIKKITLYKLLSIGQTDLILFLPIAQMRRFTFSYIRNEEKANHPLVRFVEDFFPDRRHDIWNNQLNEYQYIKSIEESLSFGGEVYSTSFVIQRNSSNHFAVFFMSRHPKAFEACLDVKWSMDEDEGRGFVLPQEADLLTGLFKDQKKEESAAQLKEALFKYLKTARNNCQIYDKVLRLGFLPKHANSVLKEMLKEEAIFVRSTYGNKLKKGSFYLSEKSRKVIISRKAI